MARNPTKFAPDQTLEAVQAKDILDEAIEARHIGDGEIIEAKIGHGAVKKDKIADGAVTTEKLADYAVTSIKIAEAAISTDKVADSAIITDEIADEAVTADKIANGVIPDVSAIPDINAKTEKVTLVDDDIFLIEDSEDTFAKKKVKKSSIGGGGGGAVNAAGVETLAGNGNAIPIVLNYNITSGAAPIAIYTANAPYKFEIIDVVVQSRANVANFAAVKVTDGTDDITDLIKYNVDKEKNSASSIDDAKATILANGSLSLLFSVNPPLGTLHTTATSGELATPVDSSDITFRFNPCCFDDGMFGSGVRNFLWIGEKQWKQEVGAGENIDFLYVGQETGSEIFGTVKLALDTDPENPIPETWNSFAQKPYSGPKHLTWPRGAIKLYYDYDAWMTAFENNNSDIIITIEGSTYKGSVSNANLVTTYEGVIGPAGGGAQIVDDIRGLVTINAIKRT